MPGDPAGFADTGWEERLAWGLTELGVAASADALDRLEAYMELLIRWNRAHGLTAATTRSWLAIRHLLDSASVLPHLPPGRMLDAGSGAGLPGLVLAILCPRTPWLLLDSSARKIAFIRHVRAELDLGNVEAVHERLERYDPAEPPAAVVARALAPLPKLVALAAGDCCSRGSLLDRHARSPSFRESSCLLCPK